MRATLAELAVQAAALRASQRVTGKKSFLTWKSMRCNWWCGTSCASSAHRNAGNNVQAESAGPAELAVLAELAELGSHSSRYNCDEWGTPG